MLLQLLLFILLLFLNILGIVGDRLVESGVVHLGCRFFALGDSDVDFKRWQQ